MSLRWRRKLNVRERNFNSALKTTVKTFGIIVGSFSASKNRHTFGTKRTAFCPSHTFFVLYLPYSWLSCYSLLPFLQLSSALWLTRVHSWRWQLINQSINQSFILLITHQAMKQFQFEHKTRRAGQPGTRCTYGCPYKTYKNLKTTVAVTNAYALYAWVCHLQLCWRFLTRAFYTSVFVYTLFPLHAHSVFTMCLC